MKSPLVSIWNLKVIPTILLVLAMLTAKIRPETKTPPILLTPSIYGPASASFTSKGATGETGFLENLLEPPSIGTTCMQSTLHIAPYTPCLMRRGTQVFRTLKEDYKICFFFRPVRLSSFLWEFTTSIRQANRSLPAMDETCSCEDENWKCGSVSEKPPDMLLSVENTTDEVSQLTTKSNRLWRQIVS